MNASKNSSHLVTNIEPHSHTLCCVSAAFAVHFTACVMYKQGNEKITFFRPLFSGSGEEVCSNSGQSQRHIRFFPPLSPAQSPGLSGPFVRIIIWLLTATLPKIKRVLHWFKDTT